MPMFSATPSTLLPRIVSAHSAGIWDLGPQKLCLRTICLSWILGPLCPPHRVILATIPSEMLRPGQSQPGRAERPSQGLAKLLEFMEVPRKFQSFSKCGLCIRISQHSTKSTEPSFPWGVSLEPTFRASLGAGGPSSEDLALGILFSLVSVWESATGLKGHTQHLWEGECFGSHHLPDTWVSTMSMGESWRKHYSCQRTLWKCIFPMK